MNNDLISREAVLKLAYWEGSGHIRYGVVDTDDIENLPAVDAVPVVRCGECKHRRDDEDYVSGHYCVKRPSNGGYFCEDNDFCSYGERRKPAKKPAKK